MENIFRFNKNIGERINQRGPTCYPEGWKACPYLVGPLDLHRPQLQLYIIHFRGEKNVREGFIAFYDMEPPSSPNLSREG